MRVSSAAAAACALLSLALCLSACGDGGPAGAGKDLTVGAETQRSKAVGGESCRGQTRDFLGHLDALRSEVAVGLTYDAYLDEVRALKSSYAEVPVERLGVACLIAVGTPAERALNLYIEATNAWGDCLSVATCDLGSVEPELQRRWRQGSDRLSAAQRALRAM
jgi:hypothetical protein